MVRSNKPPSQKSLMAKKRSPKAKSDDQNLEESEENVDFEVSLREVESIVAKLESGELGLTESLHQYETGVRELKRCHAMLEQAEQKVSVLSGFDADGNAVVKPLDEDAEIPTKQSKVRARKRKPTSGKSGHAQDTLEQSNQRSESVDDSPGLF